MPPEFEHNRVQLTADALDDLLDLKERSPEFVKEAFRVLAAVDRGDFIPKRLRHFGKSGDLSDCSRVYFGIGGSRDTHRIVFRHTGDHVEILEVVAVAERTGDAPYLLAGLRLDRIEDPVRRSDAERAVWRARNPREP